MNCCGKKRSNLAIRSIPRNKPVNQRSGSVARTGYASVVEYTGPTSLVVRGPVSGQLYRFPSPGARLLVDGEDAEYLLAIPDLKRNRI
jgi:hypothetical protein